MNFDTLLKTQKNAIKLFQNSLRKDRLVHTYLFEGSKGTSKLEAAYYFAAMILCKAPKKPCHQCDDCLKVEKEIHPSIFLVEAENGTIRKDQVERLEKEFSLTALNDDGRIYIIQDIDKATNAAANSLLKFLEEMEGDKYGIMLTENLNRVLPTIRSRSQIVSFMKLPDSVIAEELMIRGVDPEVSRVLSKITNSIDDCLELIGEGKILDLMELVKKIVLSLANKQKDPVLVMYEEGEFLLKEQNKKYHQIFLDLLITLVYDQLYYILGEKEGIVFKDTIEKVAPYLEDNYQEKVGEVEKLLSFKQRLNYNINLELFYADLLIEIVR